jgi:hypothetical protein
MHTDPNQAAAFDFAERVNRLYAALISTASIASVLESEPTLGGHLLYAAELDPEGRALVVAANIAGAASLTATSDQAAQKQAVRDGVVDFLVHSLDEALRILKNEIRKRQTVAVCVAASPESVERDMLQRGVLPDLLSPFVPSHLSYEEFQEQGARIVTHLPDQANQVLISWHVASSPTQWLPKLDVIALDCLNPEDWPARRWLRLAPRYLGRLTEGLRVASFSQQAKQAFISRIEEGRRTGMIGVEVDIQTIEPTS